jgi:hypothetical protein
MLRAAKCSESLPTARRCREHLPASNNGARDTRTAWAQPSSGMADRLGSLSFAFRLLTPNRAAYVAARRDQGSVG